MTRDARGRLQDIAEALAAITDYVGGSLTTPSIDAPVVLDVVLFRLLVVGEAAKHLDATMPAGAPVGLLFVDWETGGGWRRLGRPARQ